MRRASVIAGALLCGCVRAGPPAAPAVGAGVHSEAPGEPGAVSGEREPQAVAAPNGKEPPPQPRAEDGRCEPMPKKGEPCRAGDGYCVLSWGEPGGYSEALWCRDGRWQLEQERNLP